MWVCSYVIALMINVAIYSEMLDAYISDINNIIVIAVSSANI